MKSVLIVDDEPGTDSFFQRGLTSRFDVIETAGDTATAMLERCHFQNKFSGKRCVERGSKPGGVHSVSCKTCSVAKGGDELNTAV